MKWQESVWPQFQFVMSKRRIPSVFSQIFLFQFFLGIFTFKIYSFFICQFKWISNKNFQVFTFVKILNHSPAQELSNKKKSQLSASSVGWGIPPIIYLVLTQTRYTLCVHCAYWMPWSLTVCISEANVFCFLSSLPLLPSHGSVWVLPEPVFVNLLRSPGIESQPDGPVRQSYLTYILTYKFGLCHLSSLKGTQEWEFFWLRFWNLYFFVDSLA